MFPEKEQAMAFPKVPTPPPLACLYTTQERGRILRQRIQVDRRPCHA
jgi:hypothetical protein